jgi:hypothetical protein
VKLLAWTIAANLALLFLSQATLPSASAAEISIKSHGWGRYSPGAWRINRVTTETLDEDGNIVSTIVKEELVRLIAVRRKTVALQIESTVEVGGRTLSAPAQLVSLGVHGEAESRELDAQDLGQQNTVVGGRRVSCRVHSFRVADRDQQKEVKVHFSIDVEPRIVRRETITRGPDQKQKYRKEVQVVSFEQPQKILDRVVSASQVKTLLVNGKSSTVTIALHSQEVPGEVISSKSKETDDAGAVIRRSTLEVLDYGYTPPDNSWNFRSRRQYRRFVRRNLR